MRDHQFLSAFFAHSLHVFVGKGSTEPEFIPLDGRVTCLAFSRAEGLVALMGAGAEYREMAAAAAIEICRARGAVLGFDLDQEHGRILLEADLIALEAMAMTALTRQEIAADFVPEYAAPDAALVTLIGDFLRQLDAPIPIHYLENGAVPTLVLARQSLGQSLAVFLALQDELLQSTASAAVDIAVFEADDPRLAEIRARGYAFQSSPSHQTVPNLRGFGR